MATFRTFVFQQQRKYWAAIVICSLLQWTIFKFLYPFPSFYWDSYSYIYAAYQHLDVEIWPIGYSWLLAGFHQITSSDTALVSVQYGIYVVSALFLYFTTIYFFIPGKMVRIGLTIFLFFDPLFFYFSNYIGSDNLFMSGSLCWLAQLIWILQRPARWQVVSQAVTFFILFTIRYNAMIYPIVAAVAFILSRHRVPAKTLGVILGPLLILPFILFSSNAARKLTGSGQFPPIVGGWQWGNNALYMRKYIEVDSNTLPSAQTRELDRIAREYFQNEPRQYSDLSSIPANFFMVARGSPMWQYLLRNYPQKNLADYHNFSDFIASYGKVSPVFDQYGKYLIRRHPDAFFRYFVGLNLPNYFLPPLESFARYNSGQDTVNEMAQVWFQYPNNKVRAASKDVQKYFFKALPVLFCMLNLVFFGYGIYFWVGRLYRRTPAGFNKVLLLAVLLAILNFGFSVTAAIIIMRYQIFPLMILFVFSLLLIDQLLTPRSDPVYSTTKSRETTGYTV